jgi:hypothetical protein
VEKEKAMEKTLKFYEALILYFSLLPQHRPRGKGVMYV